MDIYQFIIQFIQFTVPPVTTLLAGYIGVRFGLKQLREQKKIDIIEMQLNKFYSPLLAFHKEVRSKAEVRLKIKNIGDKIWEKKSEQVILCDSSGTTAINHSMEYLDKEINYNNKQFEEEMFPLYNKMLDIFRDNYWLAEPETKKYYYDLVEYVEVWKRWLDKNLDPAIAREIDSKEENLRPFYEELEKRIENLKKQLK